MSTFVSPQLCLSLCCPPHLLQLSPLPLYLLPSLTPHLLPSSSTTARPSSCLHSTHFSPYCVRLNCSPALSAPSCIDITHFSKISGSLFVLLHCLSLLSLCLGILSWHHHSYSYHGFKGRGTVKSFFDQTDRLAATLCFLRSPRNNEADSGVILY